MQRSWVVLPVGVVAVLLSQLNPPSAPSSGRPGYVDPVALAAATEAASWHCHLPARTHDNRTQARALAPAPLEVTASDAGEARNARPAPQAIDGLGTAPGQNPGVEITGNLSGPGQVDTFQVPMRAGDVLGATVQGAGRRMEIRDPGNQLMEGSESDRSASYPVGSALPAGGNATVDHVAAVAGTHTIAVSGDAGTYQVRLLLRRPPAEGEQRIVLEFGPATVDIAKFGLQMPGPGQRQLSSLKSFLPRWGLRDSDEPALIQRIADTVTENLRTASGLSGVQVTTSTDGHGEFGRQNVSRVVVGGTVAETGLDTVGIAESVDPGNLAREETALVLLDTLSGPVDRPDSLNHYLANGGDRVAFIGRAVGNIVSHEAGHFLGSWHTDPSSARHDLMAPGDLIGAFGFGADDVGGTADDIRSKFGQDAFDPDEGFTGTEDTRNRTAVGLGGGVDPTSG